MRIFQWLHQQRATFIFVECSVKLLKHKGEFFCITNISATRQQQNLLPRFCCFTKLYKMPQQNSTKCWKSLFEKHDALFSRFLVGCSFREKNVKILGKTFEYFMLRKKEKGWYAVSFFFGLWKKSRKFKGGGKMPLKFYFMGFSYFYSSKGRTSFATTQYQQYAHG